MIICMHVYTDVLLQYLHVNIYVRKLITHAAKLRTYK